MTLISRVNLHNKFLGLEGILSHVSNKSETFSKERINRKYYNLTFKLDTE